MLVNILYPEFGSLVGYLKNFMGSAHQEGFKQI